MNDIRQLVPSSPQFPHANKPKTKRPEVKSRSFADYMPPKERGHQRIPHPEALKRLIDDALEAMKAGVYWDRGSILNIQV